jgi:hypothetical protein
LNMSLSGAQAQLENLEERKTIVPP